MNAALSHGFIAGAMKRIEVFKRMESASLLFASLEKDI